MPENQAKNEETLPQQLAVALDWQIPPNTPNFYANNMLVQYGEYEVILLFFETMPPLIFGTPEEMKRQVESLKSVPAKCVARVSIAKELLPKIVVAIQDRSAKAIAA